MGCRSVLQPRQAIAQRALRGAQSLSSVTETSPETLILSSTYKSFRSTDIVFANAGISGRTPVGSTDEAVFENIIRVNLTGAFLTVQAALPSR
ncbi:SDR family NAD(P)-dependent oxidoreductase [Scytonema sp. PCC 10023]|uniref:SDR family NAD(P)-dependent oxidoreductase n=1 Tax=Scytonema sp. PCC 10023 TaxID=1680591 RepID=UPI0039C5C9E0